MPGYSCSLKQLLKLISKDEVKLETLEYYLDCVKSELKGYDAETDDLKLENNDTNRPDLWSAEGTARQILGCHFNEHKNYNFFEKDAKAGNKIIASASVNSIRPFIGGFSVSGITVDEPLLNQIIQAQEKLCDNFGRMRKLIAIGVYDSKNIKLPIHYDAVSPETTSFSPLGFEEKMTLTEILEKHPKGIQYAGIVKEFSEYPLITDASGHVLSFPPVINSNDLGKVKSGDTDLFVEVTGTDKMAVILAVNIMACNLADHGAEIEPFITEYSSGEQFKLPLRFNDSVELELGNLEKLCGDKVDMKNLENALIRMGHKVTVKNGSCECVPAPYRRDCLHPVDLAEDYCIAVGFNNFEPVLPDSFTVGGEAEHTKRSRLIQELLVGMNFQEVMTYILTSKDGQCSKMEHNGPIIEIGNPMTETFGVVRERLIPILLEIESKNPRVEYPHRIFETGETAHISPNTPEGIETVHKAGALIAHSEANFSEIHSVLQSLMYYLDKEYSLSEIDNPSFIKGRAGKIISSGKEIGVIGEIHPKVLENWGITMPCAGFEMLIG